MNLQTIERQPQIVLPLTQEKSSQGFVEGIQNFVKQYLNEYEVRDVERVTDFLFKNQFLVDVLLEIPAQVRRVFGEDQKLVLSFWLDPEDPTWHHVQVLIPTKNAAKKSSDLMDKFDEEWWLDNCQRVDSKLSISKEY
ncbi:hypothetical protein BH24ACI2_BH24ACI2_11180 [soil metagenome]|nr:hypothetical protein [Acidobacteriota bacterium]